MQVEFIIPAALSFALAVVLGRSRRLRALVLHAFRHPLQEVTVIEWDDGSVEVRPKHGEEP
jgi:hypothetical protein